MYLNSCNTDSSQPARLLRCQPGAAVSRFYLPVEANGDRRRAGGETAEDLVRLTASFPTPRDAVSYIMDTFPTVKRNDEAEYGDYRTNLLILDIYDRMQEAITTGRSHETILSPPPADPSCCYPPVRAISYRSPRRFP